MRAFLFTFTAILLAVASFAAQAQVWRPTAERPISLHWVLDHALDVTNPVELGLRDY